MNSSISPVSARSGATILALALAAALSACSPTEPTQAPPAAAGEPAATAPADGQPAATGAAASGPGVLAQAAVDVERNEIKTCNIESIDAQPFATGPLPVRAGGQFVVAGFLFDEPSQSVPANLRLRVVSPDWQQAWETSIDGRSERPGLPEYMKVGEWALHSGWSQAVQVGNLPAGRYHIEVSYESAGKRFVCDNGRDIEVTAG